MIFLGTWVDTFFSRGRGGNHSHYLKCVQSNCSTNTIQFFRKILDMGLMIDIYTTNYVTMFMEWVNEECGAEMAVHLYPLSLTGMFETQGLSACVIDWPVDAIFSTDSWRIQSDEGRCFIFREELRATYIHVLCYGFDVTLVTMSLLTLISVIMLPSPDDFLSMHDSIQVKPHIPSTNNLLLSIYHDFGHSA